MRKFIAAVTLGLTLPLAACFDVDLSLGFPDDETAVATMVMTAGPEFYAMATSDGEPFCADGTETTLDDGKHRCTQTVSGPIDEVLSSPDIGEGMTIEKRDGGLVYVTFDMGDIGKEVTPPDEAGGDSEDLKQMMTAAFAGHAITLSVSGKKIVESNGTISDDGKTATFTIPLDGLITEQNGLPDAFETLLKPGK